MTDFPTDWVISWAEHRPNGWRISAEPKGTKAMPSPHQVVAYGVTLRTALVEAAQKIEARYGKEEAND